ncbi:hypothetical protein [Streptomyces nojiriensis]|uniref:hypothetical protein n=1 Tax=Streptomyces nojiriensis TaxID=66374 RepID=UPI00364734F8
MKEARRLTNCWTSGDRTVDSVDLPRHECGVLRRLAGLEFVPQPVDLFREREHTFLVEERVDGMAFHDFRAQDDVILAPYIRREGRVERLVPRFREVAGRLIHMIEQVTPAGGLGDLSPNNILIVRRRCWPTARAGAPPGSSTRTGCFPATTRTPPRCSSTAASRPPPRRLHGVHDEPAQRGLRRLRAGPDAPFPGERPFVEL